MSAATIERPHSQVAERHFERIPSHELFGDVLGDPYMALANARDVVASRIGMVPELAPSLRGLRTLMDAAHDALAQLEHRGDLSLVEPARAALASACAVMDLCREAGQYEDGCLYAAEMLMALAALSFDLNYPESAHA